MSALIQKIPGSNFSDTSLPILQRDSLINAGSLYLFDFADPYCWAKQAAPATTGDVALNLVSGGPSAAFLNGGGLTFGGGGIALTIGTGSNTTNLVELGSNYDLNALGSPDFLRIAWLKLSAGYSTSSDQVIVGRMLNTASNGVQSGIALTGAGPTTEGRIAGTASATTARPAGGNLVQDVVAQVGFSWCAGSMQMYLNGVASGGATAKAGPLGNPSITERMFKNGGFNAFVGTIYRALLENLTTSAAAAGKTTAAQAAAQIAADYAANTGRFT